MNICLNMIRPINYRDTVRKNILSFIQNYYPKINEDGQEDKKNRGEILLGTTNKEKEYVEQERLHKEKEIVGE